MAADSVEAETEAYAEGLPIVELCGQSARPRLLAVFATKRDREFTVTELARQAGLSRKAVYDHVDDLVELGVADEIDAGSSTRYRTADSEAAAKLYELDGVVLRRLLELEEHQ